MSAAPYKTQEVRDGFSSPHSCCNIMEHQVNAYKSSKMVHFSNAGCTLPDCSLPLLPIFSL